MGLVQLEQTLPEKNNMKTHGLVLGKFAPLHKGHQLMIETALQEMDEVSLIIYHTSLYHIPLSVRAAWIKQLYPSINVIEAPDGPEVVSDAPEIKKIHEEYILKKLGGTEITHFYSSEFYGEHVSKALNAVDRRIDDSRIQIPISGTEIRKNSFACRSFISDTVYRDLICKCVFLGAPSTGKTTLCEALADEFNTQWVPEYGREYWETHEINHRFPLEGFNEIVVEHQKREEAAFLRSNRFCFIDTNAMTTRLFALDYHNRSTELVEHTADQNKDRYDIFFLCGDDIPYADTPDRSGDQKRHEFQQLIIDDLKQRGINYITLTGSLRERIEKVASILKKTPF